ncbi:MAG TPA: ABC transporter permease [Rhizomicrobium sp.]|jgi:putative ABC transport system permease protein|nr:ABC transporter permease [Rhizomicrobium sp.]
MKYLPLVWAAIMRRPARAILTLLSVMIAFTLFGMTIGMNATFDKVSAAARNDRIYSNARFGGSQMQVAMARQIEQLPGVAVVAYDSVLVGYHTEPRNRVFVLMADDKLGKSLTEWPITPAQWDAIRKNRTGILVSRLQAERWHLKTGDNFTITSPQNRRTDGSPWTLKVLDVVEDVPYMSPGYMLGNYEYFNKSRPLASQDKVDQYFVQTTDPGRTAEIAQAIDNHFANSAIPTQSITEKAALDVSNSGVDIAAVDRDIALAGMFMVLFLTANGIAQSVRERFIEFATLKTIGFSDRGVMALVFLEAAVPCLLGAALGVGLAGSVSGYLPRLLPPGNGVPIPTVSPMVVGWAVICAAVVALASSALPALRLRQMDIATALSGRT